MSYLYASNLDSLDRRNQLEIQLDNGTTALLRKGHFYELSTNEVNRARRYIVLTSSGTSADEEPIGIRYLPVKGNPAEGQVPQWSMAEGVFIPHDPTGGTGGGGGTDNLYTTVDTGEIFKLITLHDGTVRAVPQAVQPPGTPVGLVRTVKLTSVSLAWSAPAGQVSKFFIYRDSVKIAESTVPSYIDATVVAGATYSYRVAAVDQYGEIGPASTAVTAFIDPTLNVAPSDVEIRWWPAEIPLAGIAIIRVNGTDLDTQQLAYTLGVDSGALSPTDDPTTWHFSI